ncbi:MAG: Periplasmic binding protein [Thermotoga sp. 50_1627]|uniref:ABC transporter substrate-binding protein n=1 Tax=Pseudothermotoga sp. TaxID=2033661 RepID=UPI00076C54F6|nr:MAG: Periplasmic binding protein [Thermotoga sp. 50_64]KUK25993.1 MAG: Periplasmic binding protein [Thermotoga sp. 50_1627]MBC7116320.1 ABC transporter substrate-binding protein [Pseudothermotoga sp.]MDK2922682.1 cobalamin transport system substrate-binding protein [Pseudothermotoga sp.]HBT38656.1 cobalamin-binding protein [Pseudothermotoga sp.]
MRRFATLLLLIVLLTLTWSYPITVVDDAGRVVTIPQRPERVICAAPSTTKFLQYLGLEDKIIAVTNWDDFEAERIGDLFPLNLEKILSLNPDLVFIFGGFQLPEVVKLEQHGLTAVVLNANSVQQILNDLILVGTIMNVPEKARKLANQLQERYLNVAKKAYNIPFDKRVKVAYLMDIPGPDVREIWTCGQGSYLNDLIALAGGANIAASFSGPNGFLPISLEYIVSQDPDVLIVASYVPNSEEQIKEKISNHPILRSLKAVRNKRIYVYDNYLLSLPVPQLVEYIETFYNDFYGGK